MQPGVNPVTLHCPRSARDTAGAGDRCPDTSCAPLAWEQPRTETPTPQPRGRCGWPGRQLPASTSADKVPSGVRAGLHCLQGPLTTCTHVKQLLLDVGLRGGTQGQGDGDPLQPEV